MQYEERTEEKLNLRFKAGARRAHEKGKHALFKLLFGRTMVTVALILVQIYFMYEVISRVQYAGIFKNIFDFLGAVAIVYIINSEENPAFKLTWILPICLFPVFGVALYLFIMLNPGNRTIQKALGIRIDETKPYLQTEYRVIEKIKKEDSGIQNLGRYIQKYNNFPTYDHTKVSFFSTGEEKYEDFMEELKKAEKFIFIEYFIINRGVIWDSVLEILEEKARQGVEVRVMYDGMCSLVALPHNYPKELREKGIHAKVFAPIKPFLSTHQNNRDHRKILVIDGKIAYNGGINLADEYMNRKKRFGHWKDTAVKLEGDAVKSFTLMFLQMWNLAERGEEDYEKYILPPTGLNLGAGFVIPYNDDPTNRLDVAESVYLDIINRATSYVHIMTPYLIIDNEMVTALEFAARRGVDVKIILPGIPDKKAIYAIARTYYPQLLAAGVKIYEYVPGFVHAKEFVSDDCKAVVGTINLDFRSLYEHFECGTYIYKNPVVNEIEKDFQETLKKCRKVDYQYYIDLPWWYRITGHVLRLFGPLV